MMSLEDNEFARRMGVLLQEMVAAYDDRVDFIRELEAVPGIAIAVKTAEFLNDALWKDDRRIQREINALCVRATAIVDERESFVDELDMLAGRPVPAWQYSEMSIELIGSGKRRFQSRSEGKTWTFET
ncbi:hypothetical protein Tco_1491854 [Tanacetum coccineum]